MGGRITRYYPGGNTPDGYLSFFDKVISWAEARNIILIKGGPGVGKSTFLKKIARELLKRDTDLEFLHCSADNGSIDGLLIPAYGIALLDGTAPHMMDPKYPGCIDEIINLGRYWNEDGIRQNKDRILAIHDEIQSCYKRAYNYLKMAQIVHGDLKQVYQKAVNEKLLNNTIDEVLNETFKEVNKRNKTSRQRHMFASAITHDGPVNYLDSLFWNVQKRFIITGFPGSGKSLLMKAVADNAILKGYDVDIFHCPMEPSKIEHILIKDLNIGFITSVKPHTTTKVKENDELIDLNSLLNLSKIKETEEIINYDDSIFWDLFNRSVKYLANVKKLHDELERFYIANMNFEEIDKMRERVLSRVLKFMYSAS